MIKLDLRVGAISLLTAGIAGSGLACSEGVPIYSYYSAVDTPYHGQMFEDFVYGDDPDGIFPMTYGKACSFAFAGPSDDMFGTPVTKAKGGLLVQTIVNQSGCSPESHLVVADCQQRKAAVLTGRGPFPEAGAVTVAGYTPSTIGHHLEPDGPINIWRVNSVSTVVRSASETGLKVYETDQVDEFSATYLGSDRVDPFCGCTFHYPDSQGAKR